MLQTTLAEPIVFEGKGLHTGRYVRMTVKPAGEGEGVVFVRKDISPSARVPALVENVSGTSRSTCLSCGEVGVRTVEHLLSALTGMGVDNALVELDGEEVPILDGSARQYAEAFVPSALKELGQERSFLDIPSPLEINDPSSGAYIRIEPSEVPVYSITADYSSRVLGVQKAFWDPSVSYREEVAPCRTFVFFHELEYLLGSHLIGGGDVDNAIVVVEHPVSPDRLEEMARLFGQPRLDVTPEGYLSNLTLRFPNECGRHKLLDLIGDMRLCGGFLRAKVSAYKPGHSINTRAAKAVSELIKNQQKG